MWLFVIFVVIPLIEIALFLKVGGLIGIWPTLAIIIALSFFGTWLLRTQGAMAFQDLRRAMAEMRDPAEPMAHGAMILFAGILLVTPGFFTDALGLALLIRPVRAWVMRRVARHIQIMTPTSPTRGAARPASDEVIEGSFSEVDTKPADAGASGWTRH